MSSAMLVELWQEIKSYIPVKDRMDVADKIVQKFDDYGLADGIEDEIGLDKTLRTAVLSYYQLEEEEDGQYDE